MFLESKYRELSARPPYALHGFSLPVCACRELSTSIRDTIVTDAKRTRTETEILLRIAIFSIVRLPELPARVAYRKR
jgi:hypothetical protein